MITLHKLGRADEAFQLNPDLIVTIESTPDTVVTLATTAKVVVAETPRRSPPQCACGAWTFSPRRCAAAGPSTSRAGGHQSKVCPGVRGSTEGLRPAADERGR